MAHSSAIDDEVRISGLNSETVAEIVGLIRAEIKAGGMQSRPPASASGPTFNVGGQIWAAAGTAIATATLIVGIFLWQLTDLREDMRADSQSIRMEIGSVRAEIRSVRAEIEAEIGSVREEIGSVRAEIGSVRAEIGSVREEVGTLRGEVAALRERIARVETLLLDRLPAAP